MVNEWVKVELYGVNNDGAPRRYVIATGTSVSKGTLMTLTTPRTATVAGATAAPSAGSAAEDHDANVGVTSISCYTDGIFRAVASAAISVGDAVMNAENNNVRTATVAASGAKILGYALEDIADLATGSIRLML